VHWRIARRQGAFVEIIEFDADRHAVGKPHHIHADVLAPVNMAAPARQMPPKLVSYCFKQPGRNETVMETIAPTGNMSEVKGPIVLAGATRINVRLLRGQTQVVCHACRDQLRAFALARLAMRYWQISDPKRLSTGKIFDFQEIDNQAWPVSSAVRRRRPIGPAPNKSIMDDKAEFRPRKRHQSSISAFRLLCRSSILFAAIRSIFSTGISSIRYANFRF